MSEPVWLQPDFEAVTDKIPSLRPALEFADLFPWQPRAPGFRSLVQIILEQQVSVKAARALWTKLDAAYPNVTPRQILDASDDGLAACGFSRQKRGYAKHLASSILDGSFSTEGLADLSDADVLSEITKLRGLGPWSAEVYLMFVLARRDVMPAGDLALQIAWAEVTGREERPKPDALREETAHLSPRRTALSYLLWRYYLARQSGRLPTLHKQQATAP